MGGIGGGGRREEEENGGWSRGAGGGGELIWHWFWFWFFWGTAGLAARARAGACAPELAAGRGGRQPQPASNGRRVASRPPGAVSFLRYIRVGFAGDVRCCRCARCQCPCGGAAPADAAEEPNGMESIGSGGIGVVGWLPGWPWLGLAHSGWRRAGLNVRCRVPRGRSRHAPAPCSAQGCSSGIQWVTASHIRRQAGSAHSRRVAALIV